jgi:carbonic anhydrase
MTSALEALESLREGNRRFMWGVRDVSTLTNQSRCAELVPGQRPFAAVLGCSDPRVPVEIVFDQGPGSLFVVRVAGNVATASQIDSVEFAVERLGTPLVVVLGHTKCLAVETTLEELAGPAADGPREPHSIFDSIRPAVEGLLAAGPEHDREALMRQAVRANVRAAADRLRHGSAAIEELIRDGRLLVVGAEYSLETGTVDFFDGLPS